MGKKSKTLNGLPRSVRVGPFDVAIFIHDFDDVDTMGDSAYGSLIIRVSRQQASGPFAVDTVLHELEHIVCKTYHLTKEDSEERQVSIRATVWTQIFRDNPDLIKWMSVALKTRS